MSFMGFGLNLQQAADGIEFMRGACNVRLWGLTPRGKVASFESCEGAVLSRVMLAFGR